MNNEKETDERAYIKHLISQIRCPVCHHRYNANDVLVIDHKDDLWLMGLSCAECETQGLVLAIVANRQVPAEPFTELAPEEVAYFENRGPITDDDLLDFCEFLRDYDGDVFELLDDAL